MLDTDVVRFQLDKGSGKDLRKVDLIFSELLDIAQLVCCQLGEIISFDLLNLVGVVMSLILLVLLFSRDLV